MGATTLLIGHGGAGVNAAVALAAALAGELVGLLRRRRARTA